MLAAISGSGQKPPPPPPAPVVQQEVRAAPIAPPPSLTDAQLLVVANRLLLLTHSGQFRSRDLHARALAVLERVRVDSPEYSEAARLRRAITAAYEGKGAAPPSPDGSLLPGELLRALEGPMPAAARPSEASRPVPAPRAEEGARLAAVTSGYDPATPQYVPPTMLRELAPARVGCQENGSCYGDTSVATGRPKTVEVHGYYRKNGTYVRGHYRSK